MFHYTDVLHIVKLFLGLFVAHQTAWRRTSPTNHNTHPTTRGRRGKKLCVSLTERV
jgi:hypothetical protein